ncbi:MAG: hypothetical protein K0B06_07645 [Brevefilum sp.]|nr:hypothetical protein [Brevefilum sp.]
MNVPYIPGNARPPELPLGRFLPPIPPGMAQVWCRENLNPGDWVLEPFGFNPLLVIEIAAAGYPVLVTVNNPIHAFLLQVLASAPQEDELTAALQDLAIASKGDERMEPYIRGLYHVRCANCNQQIEADAFLWKKDANQPYAAKVECAFCAASGEQPLTAAALEGLTPLPPKSLHLARALNRIAERDDALRSQVENALNAYPTRPLIILQTIINKLEGLEQSPRRRELLIALILSAADRGNTLWAHPSPRNRPRQVLVPAVYQERNLWKVMEQAVSAWQVLQVPISLTHWQGRPDQPSGIYLYNGRIRELDPPPEPGFFSAVIAAIPRPNQAFWTLSALWTGWIWGQEAVGPIRQVLARQRYDWNWHSHALMGVFDAVHPLSQANLKFWGLVAENEPMLLLATLLAADAKAFKLESFAQSLDDQLAQCTWLPLKQPPSKPQPDRALSIARDAALAYLQKKGEPASYQQVHAAAITGMAAENSLAIDRFLLNVNQASSETQKWVETLFQEPHSLTRVVGGQASLEAGEWWLVDSGKVRVTLMDHLEEHIYGHLVKAVTTTAESVKSVAYQALPGIFTPQDELILNCLSSYAELVEPQLHQWSLREAEHPAAREADKQAIEKSLDLIAQQLGFHVSGKNTINWYDEHDSTPAYRFHILTSAILSPYLNVKAPPAHSNILIIPGSRANLLAFKRQRDPILKGRLDHDFLVVKYRLVRDFEVNPLLSRELFKDLIHADPPEYRATQLALL